MRSTAGVAESVAAQTLATPFNFFSSGLRQKVDQLMDILYAGGVNNPMDSIEQISYLLFLRLLTEKDELLAGLDKKYERIFSGKWSRYAWGNFVTLTGDNLFNAVRDAIESFHELPRLSETGKLLFSRATLKIYDRPTLRAVIQGIHQLDLSAHDGRDLKGDMYEYLLSKLSASGTNGQFRTPRHIIDLIVALVNPKPSQRICDPACGTAGFPISTFTPNSPPPPQPRRSPARACGWRDAEACAVEVPRRTGVHRLRQRRQHGENQHPQPVPASTGKGSSVNVEPAHYGIRRCISGQDVRLHCRQPAVRWESARRKHLGGPQLQTEHACY